MFKRVSSGLPLVLALVLAVTSYQMALVRGAAAASGQVALCVGETVQIVYVDADGAPTVAPHICPECIVAFGVGSFGYNVPAHAMAEQIVRSTLRMAQTLAPSAKPVIRVRAPPSALA